MGAPPEAGVVLKPDDVKPLILRCRRCRHEVTVFGTDREWQAIGYEEDCPNCGAVLHIPKPTPKQKVMMEEK